MMHQPVYDREPIGFRGSIPIFSTGNPYIENYERISSDHLASMRAGRSNPFIPEHLWQDMEGSTIRLIEKYSSPRDRILDIGVGLGRILCHFPDLMRYGLDISFGYLEEAQRKGIEVCYALIEDMPYRVESFDIIVCTDVLEHVLDLNCCVSKILMVLKRGGILVVRVPYREDLRAYLTSPYRYVHVRNFDEYSLRLLFERIFDCEYLEKSPGSHSPNPCYFKYPLPFVRPHLFVYRLICLAEAIDTRWSDRLVEMFYRPVEINMVYRKR